MLMECLIKREGITTVTFDRYVYEFKPRPAETDGDEVAAVCTVNSADHRDRMIGSGLYRVYERKRVAAPPVEKRPGKVAKVEPAPVTPQAPAAAQVTPVAPAAPAAPASDNPLADLDKELF